MQIVVLLAIIAAWTLGDPRIADYLAPSGWWTALALAAYLGAMAPCGRLHALLAARTLAPSASRADRNRAAMAATAEQLCLLGGFAALLWAGGARWVLCSPVGDWPLVPTLAMLGPFVSALLIMWANQHRLHVRMRLLMAAARPDQPPPAVWTRGQFLAFNVRTHLLMILAPVSLIILANDLLMMAYPLLPASIADELVAAGVVASAGLVFLLAPVLIVRIWRTSPMEDCPLLAQLGAMCKRLGLRYRRILIWRSGGVLVNAGVMGLIAPVRYILLSDGLVEQMPPEQVEAVFAHEVGHVTNHHIFYSGMFMAATGLWVFLLQEGAVTVLGLPDWWVEIATMGALAAAWGFGFGWLSRRFERQSDVAAAWLMGLPDAGRSAGNGDDGATPDGTITPHGAGTFARSLEAVARLNGILPRRFNWRHGSIASRVEYVLWLAGAGRPRAEIDRLVGRIKVGLWTALGGALAAAALLLLVEIGQ